MKNIYTFFSSVFLSGLVYAQDIQQQLDSFMLAANKARIFNGMAMIVRHDSVLLEKGYGYRDVRARRTFDAASLFQIGSLSKSFTATCVLQQVEQGRLRLNDRLGRFFPFYPIGGNVTIDQLLHHTGGIYEYSRDAHFMESIYSGHFAQQDFWKLIGDKPLDFTPGSRFHYSNSGYMILGYVLEQVTGKSYWQLVREGIFQKAGMAASGFDFTRANPVNKVTGYESIYATSLYPARIVDSSYSYSAGAIYSSAADLFKFYQALLGGKLIGKASMDSAFQPVLQDYGRGWTIQYPLGKQVVFHKGAIPGFLTMMAMIPSDRVCIILLCNARDAETDMDRCYIELFKILNDQPYVLPRLAMDMTPGSLLAYAGDYELVDNRSFQGHLVLQNGQLQLRWNNDAPVTLYAERPDYFFVKPYDMQLSFTYDANGQVAGFTAFSGGKSFVYQRIGK